jgi:hypothetical protein
MGLDMTFLKERWKPLLAGVVLGALLGSGVAGFAVYKSQEGGRKALTEIAKATAEVAACQDSLKNANVNASNSKELHAKAEVEKLELQKLLDEKKEEMEKLSASLKKAASKPAATAPRSQTGAMRPASTYTSRPTPIPQAIRENWENGL